MSSTTGSRCWTAAPRNWPAAIPLACGYTCANFCVTGGETVFQPWRILEAGDLKIGFVGAITPDTFTKSIIKDVLNEAGEPMYDFLADETGDRLCAGLQKAIDEVRQAGADYVILVSHLGSYDSITEQFRSDAVVGRLTGLDLVIDGHAHQTFSHTVTDGEGRQIPMAETGVYLRAIDPDRQRARACGPPLRDRHPAQCRALCGPGDEGLSGRDRRLVRPCHGAEDRRGVLRHDRPGCKRL